MLNFNFKILILLFTIALAGCEDKGEKDSPLVPVPVPVPAPVETVEGDNSEFTTLAEKTTIKLKFHPSYLPLTYKAVEIVYGGQYQGYFDVTDYIFLPRLTGRQSLQATFSGMDGKDIKTKTYYIEVK